MLIRVEYKLQAYMADNDAGDRSFIRIRLRLVNAHHLSRRPANPRAPQSTYIWTLGDGSVIGLPDLDDRDAAKVFAIALSVQSWRFLHSPVILSTVAVPEYKPLGPSLGVSTTLISARRVLDERSFVEAADKLKAVWIMGGARGDILREAVNSYWDALHSVQRRSRFLNLWAAFERAVNDDGIQRTGKKFDSHAAGVTGWEAAEITPLRDLSRWLKHADTVRKLPSQVARNMGQDSAKVKQLADRAIAARLGFALSTTYSR